MQLPGLPRAKRVSGRSGSAGSPLGLAAKRIPLATASHVPPPPELRTIDLDPNGPTESGSLTGAYGRISGTSMATPVVSGVAALIWSLRASESGWFDRPARPRGVPRRLGGKIAHVVDLGSDDARHVGPRAAGCAGSAADRR